MDESTPEQNKRASWSGSFGFIMAAVGSAVGLGNLWGFPYKLGANGGAIFLLFYVVLVLIVGVVVNIGEVSLGRKFRLNAVGAYRKLGKQYSFLGYMGVICGFIILSFYGVLASWSFKYFFTYLGSLFGGSGITDSAGFFTAFTSGQAEPIFYFGLILAITAFIVIKGVQKGIDKVSSVLMPALFVMLALLAIRSVTLPGASEGLAFMFKPDLSVLKDGGFGEVFSAALSQMFFSLSLGMGVMLTYGSYLPKSTNIFKCALTIPFMDTLAAILAGLVIMPAVFAYGMNPASGPTLLFIIMGEVFAAMPFGNLVGCLFYLLVIFASITSTISILEGTTSFAIDEWKLKRKTAATIVTVLVFLIGIPVALSFGLLSDATLPALNGNMLGLLDWYDYMSEYVLMTLGAFLMCVFTGWVWKPKTVIEEVERYGHKFPLKRVWAFLIKYVTPILIFLTFLTSAGFITL